MLRAFIICALCPLAGQIAFAQAGYANLEISAKVVLEDGSPIQSAPMVSLLVPGAEDLCVARELFLNGTLRLSVPPIMIHGERQKGCHISIRLTGYQEFTGYVEDGTLITLRRTGPQHEGVASVSAVRLNVPANAKKEYEIGEAALAKKKWSKAEEHFKNAVAVYPQYAMAWSELGQTLQEQNRTTEARAALFQARNADPSYTKALVQICLADGAQERWEEQLQMSVDALKMNSIEFPAAYYCHAEATLHLGRLAEAEHYAREALQLDPSRIFLQSLVLLGQIFEKQGNPSDAAIEYHNYLDLAPRGSKAVEAKEALARLQNAH